MNKIRSIDHLKVWQLRYWAFLTGAPSLTTKAELQTTLIRSLDGIKPDTGRRVVSVDMGIRNLAYCVVNTAKPQSTTKNSSPPLTVTSWTRRDLLSPSIPEISPLQDANTEQSPEMAPPDTKKAGRKLDTAAFTPQQLSKTAYNLVSALLSHEPGDIIIERQRFRSGGASAIQEWTVRVNMLESMLWASLETLRASGSRKAFFPETHAVAPRRVAEFWLAGQEVPLRPSMNLFEVQNGRGLAVQMTPRRPRSKIEKKEKVDLVKKWVVGAVDNTDVKLVFEGQAAEVAQAFKQQTSRGANKIAGGKLDDLADCLLQAVAHLRWEQNKRMVREMLREPPT